MATANAIQKLLNHEKQFSMRATLIIETLYTTILTMKMDTINVLAATEVHT